MATFLYRTPSGSGSSTIATYSVWIKRGTLGTANTLWNSYSDSNNQVIIAFDGADTLTIREKVSSSVTFQYTTNRLFRDPAAWYHICISIDTTAASADRIRIYINGIRETSFGTETIPSASLAINMNSTSYQQQFGMQGPSTEGFYGVMAHAHWIDGTAYTASDFGSTDATSGMWVPNTGPSVTYGTNGVFLKFASGALGTDSSGEGNNMTVSGTMTPTKDNAENNFCTLNPLVRQVAEETSGLSSGNTEVLFSGASWGGVTSTVAPSTGKWYFESKLVALGSNAIIGVAPADSQGKDNTSTWYIGQYSGEQGYQNNGAASNGGAAFGDTYTSADILGVALDCDNAKVYFSKNGVFQNSGDPSSGATGTGAMSLTADKFYTPAVTGNGVSNWEMNFGNGYFGTTSHGETNADDAGIGLFKYDVPAGYYALCTNNLGDQS